jgi:lipopolysaccharide export LptBFGC system permease protein LptF
VLRILHRALLGELLLNAASALAAVLVLIFLGALSLQIGKASFDDLPMAAILKSVGLFVTHTLNLTLPLAVLVTCLFTYGRLANDGEFAAARTSGVHPWQILSPALLLGAAVMVAVAALEDRVMPEAHYRTRFIADAVLTDVERVLQGAEQRLQTPAFTAKWGARRRDVDGALVLEDVDLVQLRGGKPVKWLRAAEAKPALDDENDARLVLELFDVRQTDAEHEGVAAVKYLRFDVDLDDLAARRVVRKKAVQRTNEELWSIAGRDPGSEAARRARAELDYRIALAASALMFALFGAPLGLRLRLANRAFVFLVGALVVFVGYWPLLAMAKKASDGGLAPSWALLHLPNLLLGCVSWRLVRAVCRT